MPPTNEWMKEGRKEEWMKNKDKGRSASHMLGSNTKAFPLQAWRDTYSSRKLRLPEFADNRHMEVIRLSALSTGRLYLQEILLVLISVSDLFDPRDTLRLEDVGKWKIAMITSGMEPANLLHSASTKCTTACPAVYKITLTFTNSRGTSNLRILGDEVACIKKYKMRRKICWIMRNNV